VGPDGFSPAASGLIASSAVETSRLEIFADGIFAIAATLLILDFSVVAPGGALGSALTHAWPQYAAYPVPSRS
jgi:uncharacterized membrane protein